LPLWLLTLRIYIFGSLFYKEVDTQLFPFKRALPHMKIILRRWLESTPIIIFFRFTKSGFYTQLSIPRLLKVFHMYEWVVPIPKMYYKLLNKGLNVRIFTIFSAIDILVFKTFKWLSWYTIPWSTIINALFPSKKQINFIPPGRFPL